MYVRAARHRMNCWSEGTESENTMHRWMNGRKRTKILLVNSKKKLLDTFRVGIRTVHTKRRRLLLRLLFVSRYHMRYESHIKIFNFITFCKLHNFCQLILTSKWCNFSIRKMIEMTFVVCSNSFHCNNNEKKFITFISYIFSSFVNELIGDFCALLSEWNCLQTIQDGNHRAQIVNGKYNWILKKKCVSFTKFTLGNKPYCHFK